MQISADSLDFWDANKLRTEKYYDFQNKLFTLLYRLGILKVEGKKGDVYLVKARVALKLETKRKLEESTIQRKAKQMVLADWLKAAKNKKLDLKAVIDKNGGLELIKKGE